MYDHDSEVITGYEEIFICATRSLDSGDFMKFSTNKKNCADKYTLQYDIATTGYWNQNTSVQLWETLYPLWELETNSEPLKKKEKGSHQPSVCIKLKNYRLGMLSLNFFFNHDFGVDEPTEENYNEFNFCFLAFWSEWQLKVSELRRLALICCLDGISNIEHNKLIITWTYSGKYNPNCLDCQAWKKK